MAIALIVIDDENAEILQVLVLVLVHLEEPLFSFTGRPRAVAQ
jgi:hypothetical protein